MKTCAEKEIYNSLLSLDDKAMLDLGCGNGSHSRDIAQGGNGRSVLALEVDQVQHEKNLQTQVNEPQKNLTFARGGAEAIPAEDDTFDVVLLFKSLHHVPEKDTGRALHEIHRVLKPGGFAYISEPVFMGDFIEIVKLFHNEQRVQQHAFEAIRNAVDCNLLKLVDEVFFDVPLHFADFADFETKHLDVSYRKRVSDEVRAAVKQCFEHHMTGDGADFKAPIRVDLLQKLPMREI